MHALDEVDCAAWERNNISHRTEYTESESECVLVKRVIRTRDQIAIVAVDAFLGAAGTTRPRPRATDFADPVVGQEKKNRYQSSSPETKGERRAKTPTTDRHALHDFSDFETWVFFD